MNKNSSYSQRGSLTPTTSDKSLLFNSDDTQF